MPLTHIIFFIPLYHFLQQQCGIITWAYQSALILSYWKSYHFPKQFCRGYDLTNQRYYFWILSLITQKGVFFFFFFLFFPTEIIANLPTNPSIQCNWQNADIWWHSGWAFDDFLLTLVKWSCPVMSIQCTKSSYVAKTWMPNLHFVC